MKLLVPLAASYVLICAGAAQGADVKKATKANGTFRVFVSTDLGGDPDDIQSLVHLLHRLPSLSL